MTERGVRAGGVDGAEALGLCQTRFGIVGVQDVFAEGGTMLYLMDRYGLTARHIADKALALRRRA